MLKLIFTAMMLIASNTSAGEIVFRSLTSGTLTATADPAPTQPEPEQPVLGIRYEPISVAAGTSVNMKPVGDVTGFSFTLKQPLPVGLILDPASGRIVGVAAVTGKHEITVRAVKPGFSADLVLSIIIS